MRPEQNGRRFADDVFKCTFINENQYISIQSLLLRVQLTIRQLCSSNGLASTRRQAIALTNNDPAHRHTNASLGLNELKLEVPRNYVTSCRPFWMTPSDDTQNHWWTLKRSEVPSYYLSQWYPSLLPHIYIYDDTVMMLIYIYIYATCNQHFDGILPKGPYPWQDTLDLKGWTDLCNDNGDNQSISWRRRVWKSLSVNFDSWFRWTTKWIFQIISSMEIYIH